MNKSDERAAKARSLIIKGEMQKNEIAEMCGYKSIGGMMNAITMLEHREKTGKGVSNKARRSLQSFTPYEGPTTQREQRKADRTFRGGSPWTPVDLLGGDEPKTLRVDVKRNNGLYARLEGRNLIALLEGREDAKQDQ